MYVVYFTVQDARVGLGFWRFLTVEYLLSPFGMVSVVQRPEHLLFLCLSTASPTRKRAGPPEVKCGGSEGFLAFPPSGVS